MQDPVVAGVGHPHGPVGGVDRHALRVGHARIGGEEVAVQVQLLDPVVVGIGDEHRGRGDRDPLRVVEPTLAGTERSVGGERLRRGVVDLDPTVVRVGDPYPSIRTDVEILDVAELAHARSGAEARRVRRARRRRHRRRHVGLPVHDPVVAGVPDPDRPVGSERRRLRPGQEPERRPARTSRPNVRAARVEQLHPLVQSVDPDDRPRVGCACG